MGIMIRVVKLLLTLLSTFVLLGSKQPFATHGKFPIIFLFDSAERHRIETITDDALSTMYDFLSDNLMHHSLSGAGPIYIEEYIASEGWVELDGSIGVEAARYISNPSILIHEFFHIIRYQVGAIEHVTDELYRKAKRKCKKELWRKNCDGHAMENADELWATMLQDLFCHYYSSLCIDTHRSPFTIEEAHKILEKIFPQWKLPKSSVRLHSNYRFWRERGRVFGLLVLDSLVPQLLKHLKLGAMWALIGAFVTFAGIVFPMLTQFFLNKFRKGTCP